MNISQKEEFRFIFAGLAMAGFIMQTNSINTKQLAEASVLCADALIERLDEKEVKND